MDEMFDEIFDNDNFDIIDYEDFECIDYDEIYNGYNIIYSNLGFEKIIFYLSLACADFQALKSIYEQDKSPQIYKQLIETLAKMQVLLENISAANNDMLLEVEKFSESYIKNNLNRINENVINNRIKDYFRNID